MGNVVSRCAQNVRNMWRSCSKKHTEEEAMLSTCDSEPLDKCQEPLFGPSVIGVDRAGSQSRTGSQSSLVRLEEKIQAVNCKLSSSSPKSSFKLQAPHHRTKGYTTLVSADFDSPEAYEYRPRSFVDQESQTNFDPHFSPRAPVQEPPMLSKEYIVKTYSIQNATPTPSPATQTKFSPANHSVIMSPPPEPEMKEQGFAAGGSPLAALERRQDDVLKRLEQLQATVSKLAHKYNVSASQSQSSSSTSVSQTTTSATTASNLQAQRIASSGQGDSSSVIDLVISVDPSSVPLSLVILCERLSEQFKVLKSTFVHSSVSDSVPDKLRALITSNGGIKRSDCQLAISLVWKKVANGPELVVNPVKQTPIQGEVNIVRYLARLLNPSFDEQDIIMTTQADELLDLAQLQLLEGNNKEKAAAVRTLNSTLGKRDWLIGSEPSIADIVCWSALQQTGQTASPPANVKKWLGLCNQHRTFKNVVQLLR